MGASLPSTLELDRKAVPAAYTAIIVHALNDEGVDVEYLLSSLGLQNSELIDSKI